MPDSLTYRRSYAVYQIEWERGSTWSGYLTSEDALRTLEFAGGAGVVVARYFHVDIPARHLELYRPGVGTDELVCS